MAPRKRTPLQKLGNSTAIVRGALPRDAKLQEPLQYSTTIVCCYDFCPAATPVTITATLKDGDVTIDTPLPDGWTTFGPKMSFHCPQHRKE